METLERDQSTIDTEAQQPKTLFDEAFTLAPQHYFTHEQQATAHQLEDTLLGSQILVEKTIQDSLTGDILQGKAAPDIQLAAERTLLKIKELRDMYGKKEQQEALITQALSLEEDAERIAHKTAKTTDEDARKSLFNKRDELNELASNFEAVSIANRKAAKRLTDVLVRATVGIKGTTPIFTEDFLASVEAVASKVEEDAYQVADEVRAQRKREADDVNTNDRNSIVAGAEKHLRQHEISQVDTEPTVSVDIDALAVGAAKKAIHENGVSLYAD